METTARKTPELPHEREREGEGVDLGEEQARWEKGPLTGALGRSPDRGPLAPSTSGIPVKLLYTPLDSPADSPESYMASLGFPGEFPYTRGAHPSGYRSQLWNRQQFAGYGTPEDANQRYRYLREQGQEGYSGRSMVNVAFDLPTIYGFDSDEPSVSGEVGRCGVAIDSVDDMESLLDGFDLEKTFVSMVITGPAIVLFAMLLACAERRGVPIGRLSGVMQNDPLKAYMASKFYIFPPRQAIRLVSDMIEFASQKMRSWNTVGVSGYHMREAGGTPIQELAFTVANALAYVEAAQSRGLAVDEFAPRLSFFFEVGSSFFEEIAKLRAARRLWARLMRDRYKAENPRSLVMRYHVQTAGTSLTAQQPENNIIRTAVQALAAILGGTQSLHTNSMDEALNLPSEKAVTIALRTQQILAYETGVTDTVDPLGGSYYVESLTAEVERRAMAYLDTIERMGGGSILEGVLKGIEAGFFQQELSNAAARYQEEVESKRRIVVGVNRFHSDEPLTIARFQSDPRTLERQAAKLRRLRASRDSAAVELALENVRGAIEQNGEVVRAIVEAVKAMATLGEVTRVLKSVLGEYSDVRVY